jgi:hypothetical protein
VCGPHHPAPSRTIPHHPAPSRTIPHHPAPSRTIPHHSTGSTNHDFSLGDDGVKDAGSRALALVAEVARQLARLEISRPVVGHADDAPKPHRSGCRLVCV